MGYLKTAQANRFSEMGIGHSEKQIRILKNCKISCEIRCREATIL